MNNNIKSIARVTSDNNTHYVLMAGQRGCLPDWISVRYGDTSIEPSINEITFTFDLQPYNAEFDEGDPEYGAIVNALRTNHYYEIMPYDALWETGHEYIEIQICNCDDPLIHSNTDDPEYGNVDADHALRVLENAIAADSMFWEKLANEQMNQQDDLEAAQEAVDAGDMLNDSAYMWAIENKVKIDLMLSPRLTSEKRRVMYIAAIYVNGTLIENDFDYGPSPLYLIHGYEVDKARVYDDILNFIYYYTDWTDEGEPDERESVALTHRFLSALPADARWQFINGYIDFHA